MAIDNVDLVLLSDDLGFFSGTLVSPAVLRCHILPHYKKLADIVHAAGKLLVFHSCGNIYTLMDDLLDDVRIDEKHSFEDKILPVEEAYRRWGDRVSIMGGVDMDLLGRGTEGQVCARTRQILEACAGDGGRSGGGRSTAATSPTKGPRSHPDAARDRAPSPAFPRRRTRPQGREVSCLSKNRPPSSPPRKRGPEVPIQRGFPLPRE